MSTKKIKKKRNKKKKYGTLEVELNDDDQDIIIQKYSCLYKNRPISKCWIALHFITFILSLILLIPCFIVPITGLFLTYTLILFSISIDAIITIFACKNGVCCKSKNRAINTIDDLLMIITNILWLISLIITIFCCISDTSSQYTTWNRWEEFVPIFLAIFIILLLYLKLSIRYKTYTLPFIYNTNYQNYNDNLLSNSSTYIYFLIPFKWIFFLFFMVLACTLMVHSIQKSSFINTFDDRNTQILTTANYGDFEYQCLGTVQPNTANIRIIAIGGLSTVHLSFGWYNNLIYQEFGINQGKNISICDYNRGGFGFTPTKDYKDKSIESEVDHLMEIADVIFGINSTFHLMGHSRAGLILLTAKMRYIERIESMIIFDGSSNANRIQNTAPNYTVPDRNDFGSKLLFQTYSVGLVIIPTQITGDLIIDIAGVDNKNNMYEPHLNGQYYGLRNYMAQSIIWELNDMSDGWEDTMKIYNTENDWNLGPVLNIDCNQDYDEEIVYIDVNDTLYVKTEHNPCVLDKDIAQMVFDYDDNGVKAFYDPLFN